MWDRAQSAFPTSIVVDPKLTQLANELEWCAGKKITGCSRCLIFEECNRVWNSACDRGRRRILRDKDIREIRGRLINIGAVLKHGSDGD